MIQKMSDDTFLSQVIWLNECFLSQGKYLLFKNWIRSGFLYVKDLFDSDGNWLLENLICDRLIDKSNWMCEYLTIKKVINKFCNKFDLTKAQYINVRRNFYYFEHGNILCILENQKSKYFYNILVSKKFKKPYMQNYWKKKFNLEQYIIKWESVYEQKISNIHCSKLAEIAISY